MNRASSQVSSMSWHPVRKIIAVGWTSGELLTWNEHEKALHEVYSIHKSKINTVKWSHSGHRLVTGDQVIFKNYWMRLSRLLRITQTEVSVICQINVVFVKFKI